ncbi:MAG: SurA N-terminal domain-containing protein [Prolixibacteraceae bacterium]|nr:SurA N-terminal domain-containing protein [Prolixibacteraceae bacterium]
MATLQNIRNRAGVLVAIIIGLALLAFILGDLLRAGSSILQSSKMDVGDIDGNSINYNEFQQKVEQTADVYKMNSGNTQINDQTWSKIREQVWQATIRENIMTPIYEKEGIAVSPEELFDMVQGNNIHPIVHQLFTNPQTGQFNKSAVLNFLKAIDSNAASSEQKTYWLYLEDQITKDRLFSKYIDLISKGLFITKEQAKYSLKNNSKSINIQYIKQEYNTIPDSAVNISESEINKYYKQHQSEYKEVALREIQYVVFPVKASQEDDNETKKWIDEIKSDFISCKSNKEFVNINSDVNFDDTYKKKDEISSELADFAFNGKVGDVYGPYKKDGKYQLVKIDDIANLPDSVMARHILINPQKEGSLKRATEIADSLKNRIEKGDSFDALAKKYSEDKGSVARGGNLGWFKKNQMVKEFENVCFTGKVGKIYIVNSKYGVHIIELMKKGKEEKQVKLAKLIRNIEPSNKTYQAVYANASKFASKTETEVQFLENVKKDNLNKKIARVKENDEQIIGLDQSRALIRAAYTAKPKTVIKSKEGSTIFEFGDNFVIGILSEAREDGIASLESVSPRIVMELKKDKKAEIIAAKMKKATIGNDLEATAKKLNTEVKDANNITFNSYTASYGMEPAVTGTVVNLESNKISAPIKGNTGIYIAKVISEKENANIGTEEMEAAKLRQSLVYRTNYFAYETLKSNAEIEDMRSKFY